MPIFFILFYFFIFLWGGGGIIVLNKYYTYNNKPIPKISHVKLFQNLTCKMRYNKKQNNTNVACEVIRARIALKLGRLL